MAVLPLVVVNTPLPRLLGLLLLETEERFSMAKGTLWLPILGFLPIVEPMLVPLSMTERPTPAVGVEGWDEFGEMASSVVSFSRRSESVPGAGWVMGAATGSDMVASIWMRGVRACILVTILR